MDVGPQYLRQSQPLHHGVEALRLLTAAMWPTIDDKEVYLLGSSQLVEELYLLAHPF